MLGSNISKMLIFLMNKMNLLNKRRIVFPNDLVIMGKNNSVKIKSFFYTRKRDNIVDIGPITIKKYIDFINLSKFIIWNGPLGLFEKKKFEIGTKSIAKKISEQKCFSIIGGGETNLALRKYSLVKNISYISTGGGALLEFISDYKIINKIKGV